jgi:hypothetical protein
MRTLTAYGIGVVIVLATAIRRHGIPPVLRSAMLSESRHLRLRFR